MKTTIFKMLEIPSVATLRAASLWPGAISGFYFMGGRKMKREYFKEIEGGKRVYRSANIKGEPGREMETEEWAIIDYINYCLWPLSDCIDRMAKEPGAGEMGPLSQYLNILERLYDATQMQLEKMTEAIDKDMGWVKIVTTNEDARGGFLRQVFLDAYVAKKPDDKAENA